MGAATRNPHCLPIGWGLAVSDDTSVFLLRCHHITTLSPTRDMGRSSTGGSSAQCIGRSTRSYEILHGSLDGPIACLVSRSLQDRKSTRLNSSHSQISYSLF